MSDQDVMILAREALAGDAGSLVRLIGAIVRTQGPIEPVMQEQAQRVRFSNFYCNDQVNHQHYQVSAPPDSAVPQWQLVWTHLVTAFLNQLLDDAAKRGVRIVKPGDWKPQGGPGGGGSYNYTCQELCQ